MSRKQGRPEERFLADRRRWVLETPGMSGTAQAGDSRAILGATPERGGRDFAPPPAWGRS